MATPNRRRLEYLPLDDVKPAKQNPKQHDEATLDASFERWGFTEPVLLDERTGRLVAGHGRIERLRQARDRGDTAPEGIQVLRDGTWKLPVIRGWSSRNDAEAEAYLVASNRLVESGGWDQQGLVEMLDDLRSRDGGLVGTGYSEADFETINRLLDAFSGEPLDPDDAWAAAGMPDFNQPDKVGAYRTTVHFPTEADADAFFELIGQPKKSSLWWPESDHHVGSNVREEYVAVEPDDG